jgi:hypothetical protein
VLAVVSDSCRYIGLRQGFPEALIRYPQTPVSSLPTTSTREPSPPQHLERDFSRGTINDVHPTVERYAWFSPAQLFLRHRSLHLGLGFFVDWKK